MDTLYVTFLLFSIFIGIFFCLSLLIKDRLYISETVFSFLYGILIKKTNKLNITNLKNILFHFSRILMSLQVVAVGIYVPKKYIKKEWKSLIIFLIPIMILSYIFSTVLIYFISSLFNYETITIWDALIIGACITPTDPVLASAILKGKFANKYIPPHLRNLLMVESGANDGLGWPMLAFPLIIIELKKLSNNKEINLIEFFKKFFIKSILYEVLLSIFLGFLIGYLFKKIYTFCKKKKLIDKESNLSFMLVITTLSIGLNVKFGMDDILGLFIIGLAFTYENKYLEEIKEMHFMEVIDLLFTLNFFILFGLNLDLKLLNLKNILISISMILFRRLPLVLLFYKFIPQLFNFKEALIAGWFGPIGCGAIFFSLEAEKHLKNNDSLIFNITQVIVSFSVIVHGITAPFVHLHLRNSKSGLKDKNDVIEDSGGFDSDYTDINDDIFDDLEILDMEKSNFIK